MMQGKNKLLSRLVLIGVASVGAVGTLPTVAMAVTEPTVNAAVEDAKAKIMSLVAFLRAYPNSPQAIQAAKELAGLFASLPAAERAAISRAIAESGGLPEVVAAITGLPFAATAAVAAAPVVNSIY